MAISVLVSLIQGFDAIHHDHVVGNAETVAQHLINGTGERVRHVHPVLGQWTLLVALKWIGLLQETNTLERGIDAGHCDITVKNHKNAVIY